MKMPRFKVGAHLNQMKGEYAQTTSNIIHKMKQSSTFITKSPPSIKEASPRRRNGTTSICQPNPKHQPK